MENVLNSGPGYEVIQPFSYSTQPSMTLILLINANMSTSVDILTFISRKIHGHQCQNAKSWHFSIIQHDKYHSCVF